MKIHSGEQPTMSREEMADDYLRLKFEYTRLHEDYRRLQSEKDKQLLLHGVVKRTLDRKIAAYELVNMWYEKEYDSSTPYDEVASMDKEAAELNAQIKVLRHILSEVGEL